MALSMKSPSADPQINKSSRQPEVWTLELILPLFTDHFPSLLVPVEPDPGAGAGAGLFLSLQLHQCPGLPLIGCSPPAKSCPELWGGGQTARAVVCVGGQSGLPWTEDTSMWGYVAHLMWGSIIQEEVTSLWRSII